jgi:hypothetical protein
VKRLIVFLIALIVSAFLCEAVASDPEVFCWEKSESTIGYHLYWSTEPDWWLSGNMTETTGLCVDDPAPDAFPGEVIFYVVTSYNAEGESETEHGPIV